MYKERAGTLGVSEVGVEEKLLQKLEHPGRGPADLLEPETQLLYQKLLQVRPKLHP